MTDTEINLAIQAYLGLKPTVVRFVKDYCNDRDAMAAALYDGASALANMNAEIDARRILTSTDPAVHAALAASLPAEVKAASMTDAEMLAALVDRGVLTEEDAPIARHGGYEHTHWQQRWDGQHTHEGRRFVTPWEVAP